MMSNLIKFPGPQKRSHEASAWIIRIDAGLSSEEAKELDEWLAASPDNAAALLEMGRLWDEMEIVEGLRELLPAREIHKAGSRSMASVAAAATLSGLVVALVWSQISRGPSGGVTEPVTDPQVFSTAIGDRSSTQLSDGSSIQLNTDTQVEIQYSEGERRVVLVRGEATFDVSPDPERPFSVLVGNEIVQAVGTAFNIQLKPNNGVEVAVTEGRVRVFRADAIAREASDEIPLTGLPEERQDGIVYAGEIVVVEKAARTLRKFEPEDIDIKLAWQRGMLVFRGEPLSEVLDEVSRYTTVRFDLADPELASIKIGGYFPAGDIDRLLLDLNDTFDIRAQRFGDRVILATN